MSAVRAYLLHLTNSTPSSVYAEVYGHLVERAAIRRRLLIAADEIKALAMDEQLTIEKVTGDAESRLFHVTERNLRRELIPMRDAINTYFERMEHLHPAPGRAARFADRIPRSGRTARRFAAQRPADLRRPPRHGQMRRRRNAHSHRCRLNAD